MTGCLNFNSYEKQSREKSFIKVEYKDKIYRIRSTNFCNKFGGNDDVVREELNSYLNYLRMSKDGPISFKRWKSREVAIYNSIWPGGINTIIEDDDFDYLMRASYILHDKRCRKKFDGEISGGVSEGRSIYNSSLYPSLISQYTGNDIIPEFPSGIKYPLRLKNRRRNCFANSAIQCLFSCEPFKKRINEIYPNLKGDGKEIQLIRLIKELMDKETNPSKIAAVVYPAELIKFVHGIKPDMGDGDCSDDEFFMVIISKIDEYTAEEGSDRKENRLIFSDELRDKCLTGVFLDEMDKLYKKHGLSSELFFCATVIYRECKNCKSIITIRDGKEKISLSEFYSVPITNIEHWDKPPTIKELIDDKLSRKPFQNLCGKCNGNVEEILLLSSISRLLVVSISRMQNKESNEINLERDIEIFSIKYTALCMSVFIPGSNHYCTYRRITKDVWLLINDDSHSKLDGNYIFKSETARKGITIIIYTNRPEEDIPSYN